ncbi:MAG: Lrp/AsnC family transcriptional regulator [Actinomycetota bacterium]
MRALDDLDRRLLNDFQHDFPLVARPFAAIADVTDQTEAAVMARLAWLRLDGAVSRVGAVFRPHTVGASTLAAMAVPAERLDEVAALVSACPQVNHNYQRDHRLNLWFVVACADRAEVAAVLDGIGAATGLAVLDLPLVEDYHIDLGFDLGWGSHGLRSARPAPSTPPVLDARDLDLVGVLADGLPLVERPYRSLGAAIAMDEDEVLARLQAMIEAGAIRRFGVVVRHHELGFRANAMVVWDIPDDAVAHVGAQLAAMPQVTLCYRRPRRLPTWPYNLFCMVHGRDRSSVEAAIADFGLDYPHAVLFSTRRFKQTGARYGRRAEKAAAE